jgi:hypothetical protein
MAPVCHSRDSELPPRYDFPLLVGRDDAPQCVSNSWVQIPSLTPILPTTYPILGSLGVAHSLHTGSRWPVLPKTNPRSIATSRQSWFSTPRGDVLRQ